MDAGATRQRSRSAAGGGATSVSEASCNAYRPKRKLILAVPTIFIATVHRQRFLGNRLQELFVGPRLRHLVEDDLGDVAGIEYGRCAAKHPNLAHLVGREKQLFVPRSG